MRVRQRQYLEIVFRCGTSEPLLDQPHRQGGVAADDGGYGCSRISGKHRRPFLDVMAEPRQEARNLAHGRCDFRIDGVAIRRFVGEGDAELARVAADFL